MTKEKLLDFGRANLTRLLLLAVLLTGGLALNLTARARYLTYLYDYTSVVAGSESYFSSDYLYETSEGKTFSTQLWQGNTFELTIKLRNYSNALLYNHEGTNIYYYVEGAMYEDKNCTKVDGNYDVSFEPEQSKVGTVTANGKTVDVFCLYGNDIYEENRKQLHEVRVVTKYNGNVNDLATQQSFTRYLKVNAYTVPSTFVNFTDDAAEAKAQSENKQEVFYHSLQAIFSLAKVTGAGEIVTSWEAVTSNTDYAVELQIYASGTTETSTSATYVRVFYKAEDGSVAYLTPDRDTPVYDSNGVAGLHNYVSATVYPGQVQSVYFYKYSLQQNIQHGDFYVEVSDDSFMTKDYKITANQPENGSISVQKAGNNGGALETATTARYLTPIYVTVTPDEDYRVKALTIMTDGGSGGLVKTTEVSANVFSFEMPASDITITCTFTNTPIEGSEEPGEDGEGDEEDPDNPDNPVNPEADPVIGNSP